MNTVKRQAPCSALTDGEPPKFLPAATAADIVLAARLAEAASFCSRDREGPGLAMLLHRNAVLSKPDRIPSKPLVLVTAAKRTISSCQ